MTEETAGVQPTAEGESQGAGLYDQVIQSVPENLREHVLPHFKKWDQEVSPKLSEAAEFRKQWEPYQELGLNEIDPDELKELLEFRQIAQDPEQFQQWYQQIGEMLNPDGGEDLDDEDFDAGSDPELQEIKSQFEEFKQWREQQEQEQQVQQAASQIRQQLDALSKEHGLEEDDEEFICQLALKYDDKDALQKGFADYQKLMSRAEQGVFKKKSEQPERAESGGVADTAAKPVTTFDEANKMARQRLMQAHQ